jgi:beta-galactosidase
MIDLKNWYFFTNLSNYKLNWQVLANGELVESGSVDTILTAPQMEKTLKIPYKTSFKNDVEYFLNVSVVVKTDEPLLKTGHVVAYEQFQLQKANVLLPEKATTYVSYKAKGGAITVTGKNFEITFNKKTGALTTYNFNGKSLLQTGPEVNFWRAPVDNDYGAGTQKKYKLWKNVAKQNNPVVTVKQLSKTGVQMTISRDLFDGDAKLIETYVVDGNGVIKVTNDLKAIKGKHSNFFKFGNKMVLPEAYKNIIYYGKGPFEAYADRQHAAKVGLFKQTIADQYFPYIRPQETGNKLDVRWVSLTKEDGSGIKFIGEKPLSVSALNFSEDDLHTGEEKGQHHAGEMFPRKEVFVNIDGFQQGLGSINSWGRLPMEPYMLPYKDYSYSYWMVPIGK